MYRSNLDLILRSSTLWLDELSDGEAGFAAIAHVGFWQILLQKSLLISTNSDSLALMRFASEAIGVLPW